MQTEKHLTHLEILLVIAEAAVHPAHASRSLLVAMPVEAVAHQLTRAGVAVFVQLPEDGVTCDVVSYMIVLQHRFHACSLLLRPGQLSQVVAQRVVGGLLRLHHQPIGQVQRGQRRRQRSIRGLGGGVAGRQRATVVGVNPILASQQPDGVGVAHVFMPHHEIYRIAARPAGEALVEILAGVQEVTLTAPDDEGFIPGKYYYMQFFPCTFESGFSVELVSASKKGTYQYTKSMEYPRSTWKRAANVDTRVASWENTEPTGGDNPNEVIDNPVVLGPGDLIFE